MKIATLFLLTCLLSGRLGVAADAAAPNVSLDAIEAQVKAKKYAEAVDAGRTLLPILEAQGLSESLDGARLLDLLVEACWRGSVADPKAISYGERAVAVRKKLVGPENASLATSLHLLGNLCQARGDAAAARVHYEESLAIREKVFGPESPEVVPSLNNLGNVTRTLGDLEASRRVLERALVIREKTLPPTSRDRHRRRSELLGAREHRPTDRERAGIRATQAPPAV